MNKANALFSMFLIVLIVGTIVFGFQFLSGYYRTTTVTDKILNEARVYTTKDSKYLIYGEQETYQDTDSLFFFKFNSSDIYGHIQSGHLYKLTVYGWRVPFLSWYRNIIKAEEIN